MENNPTSQNPIQNNNFDKQKKIIKILLVVGCVLVVAIIYWLIKANTEFFAFEDKKYGKYTILYTFVLFAVLLPINAFFGKQARKYYLGSFQDKIKITLFLAAIGIIAGLIIWLMTLVIK